MTLSNGSLSLANDVTVSLSVINNANAGLKILYRDRILDNVLYNIIHV